MKRAGRLPSSIETIEAGLRVGQLRNGDAPPSGFEPWRGEAGAVLHQ